MSGGHPHPHAQFGGFSSNPVSGAGTPSMRGNFNAGAGQGQVQGNMPTQLSGVMGGGMSPAGMSSMGQGQYTPGGMQGQIGNMPGMPPQSMSVVNSSPSPNQTMSSISMGTTMGTTTNITNTMPSTNMGMPGANTGTMSGNTAIVSSVQTTSQASVSPASSVSSVGQSSHSSNQPQQNKEFNTASLCRFGQETVQDIVSRTQEVFQTLKTIQPPNGTPAGAVTSNEKKAKIQEQLRTIRLLFKRLRLIYEKCNENCQVPGMEYTHIESLIPLKDEYEQNKAVDERKTSEAYRMVCEENRELMEQVVLRNKHLKEVVTNLRTIVWQINVMLNMRKT